MDVLDFNLYAHLKRKNGISNASHDATLILD